LDKFSLISNSDSHSPAKIGREANVFDCNLDYKEILDALKKKDPKRFLYTIEFFPEEGKYHFDGHRLCGISFSPEESKAHKNICPKCNRPLTIGVLNRVAQLADRPEGFKPTNAIPFKNFIPLEEIIADCKGVGKASLQVEKEYLSIIGKFGTEFEILAKVPAEELKKHISPRIAEGILRVREGKVKLFPGYDGEYGKIEIFGAEEIKDQGEQQLNLF
jgi:PHP family Zn ribbon phosphoesterase